MIRSLTSITLALTFGLTLNAQVKDSFKMGRLVTSLSNPTGWMKTDDGKWTSSQNRIPFKNPDYNHPYYDKFKVGEENFRQLRINEVSVLGQPYYLLSVHGTKGAWRDEKNQTDFYTFTSCDYYIFHKPYLNRMWPDSFKVGTPYAAHLRMLYAGSFRYTSEAQYLDKLDKRVRWNIVYDHPRDSAVHSFYTLNVNPVAGKSGPIVRFNLQLSYAGNGQEPGHPGMYIFQEKYYAVPLDRWKAFARVK